jgi:serine/arginine repetitive matrix protein 2
MQARFGMTGTLFLKKMSYNGIGLSTTRGSGTNGYVQRNLSHVRPRKSNVEYRSDEELQRNLHHRPPPNQEILEHDRKRQVELRCLELEDTLQNLGELSEEQIEEKVKLLRNNLLANLSAIAAKDK